MTNTPDSDIRRNTWLTQHLARLGPLAPVVGFFAIYLSLFSLGRLALSLWHAPQVAQIEDALWLFPVGLRMDLMLLSALLVAPSLLLLLLPSTGARYWQPLLAGLFGLLGTILLLFEAITPTFLSVYNARPNHLLVEYLANPSEITAILLTGFKLELLAGIMIMLAGGGWTARYTYRLMRAARPWFGWQRLLAVPLVLALLTLGARSSLSDSPANLGIAAFSEDSLVNELALNSSYAVAYAAYNLLSQQDALASRYGDMPRDEVIRRVRRQMLLPEEVFDDPAIPTAHLQRPAQALERPRNLVIILAESLSAEFVASLGGLPLSPRFDTLAKQGVYFTRLFATGKRSNRGLESVVTGALPLPLISAIKLRLAQSDFFTLPALLKTHGYRTSFLYGGDANFDNMRRFLSYNGIERVIEGDDIANARFRNHWGVSDEDLFAAANTLFRNNDKQNGSKPFVSVILTLSNHEPFTFPDGDFALYEQPRATQNNVARYADYALGEFFTQARKEAYYDNTVFLVVADHGVEIHRARGLIPAAKYHVPALILAPDIQPRRIDTLTSQIDLPPTVLGLLGITTRHPMPGRNLLHLPDNTPGRAIYHLGDTHAYQVDNQVILHVPGKAPRQFTLRGDELTPAALNTELQRDALAHILLPDILHREQRYRMPTQPAQTKTYPPTN